MKKLIKSASLILLILWGLYESHELSRIIHPITKSTVISDASNSTRSSLIFLGCPKAKIQAVSNGIEIASERTGISTLLISSLIYTESNFRLSATSPKGYKGIAQTPTASMIYPEVDILHGMMILKDKLRLTNGNMIEALSLYKGGRNQEARNQAQYVIKIYSKLIRRAEGVV